MEHYPGFHPNGAQILTEYALGYMYMRFHLLLLCEY